MRARMWMFQIAMIANVICWLTVVGMLGRARWTPQQDSIAPPATNTAEILSTTSASPQPLPNAATAIIDDPYLWSTAVAGLILAALLQHTTFRRLRTPQAFSAQIPHSSFKLTEPKKQTT